MATYDESIVQTVQINNVWIERKVDFYTESIVEALTASSPHTAATLTSAIALSSALIDGIASAARFLDTEFISTGTVTSPSFQVQELHDFLIGTGLVTASLVRQDETSAWAMNIKNKAFSQYDGYEFKQFFTHNGKHCGVTDQGIFELDGANDNGTDIDAFVMTGKDDFGTSDLKRVPYVYLGNKNENGMTLTTVTDDGEENTYEIPESDTLRNQRAKIGNGLRSRYWQFILRNVGGGNFIIESIELFPTAQGRKLNG